jgi:soluble lytic murein transglycosylase
MHRQLSTRDPSFPMIPRLLLLIALLLPSPALADHARDAFAAAGHGDWKHAMQHADAADDSALAALMRWQYALDSDSGASFEDISKFIAMNPEWPEQKRLRVRAELSLREGDTGHADIIQWFATQPPVTGIGKVALARALTITGGAAEEKIKTLVREAWKDGDFDEVHEKDILNSFGKILSAEDHIARADRLLWEEKTGPAKRLLPLLSDARQRLINARIALINDKTLSIIAVARVPAELKNDPGLVYDRMQYRLRRDDDDGVREMLLKAPESPPYPEKWWRARELEVRTAIDEDDYAMAEKLLARRGDLAARESADATWLSGWLALEFQKKPQAAEDIFSRMYEAVRQPPSRARAAYWAGRAAEAAGDGDAAADWYAHAGDYPTTFYGQLGLLKSSGSSPLSLPATPNIDKAAASFDNNQVVQALRLCLKYGARDTANRLIGGLIEDGTPEEAALAAKLAVDDGSSFLAVRAAKKALQKNIVLIESGYPRIDTPSGLAVEKPLVFAIARQESEFDPHAQSASGALGLIQLLPRTAKETAKKADIRFDKKRLFEPSYNLTLGSHYLSRLIESYDGSYVMAIAAYNAGPGNVRKWVRHIGTPKNDFTGAIDWIEKIPFSETRNYVQRVMENLQVYRRLEGADKLQLAEDLVR